MGKPTGFLEYTRREDGRRPAAERVRDWDEFHLPLPEEIRRQQGARCMNCGVPFCQAGMIYEGKAFGCPLHNLIPEWNDMILSGNWGHALSRLLKANSFPEFTGRVCPAPCENACICGIYGDPITVRDNELSIIEAAFGAGKLRPRRPPQWSGKKVCVVGSGPAGLAAADQLNRRGHMVTVIERAEHPGGLLMYGIPNMKLPKSVVRRRIDLMTEEGVTFVCGVDASEGAVAKRLLAEYDNYRKRTAKEKDNLYQDAKADTIKEFLAVYDNLERAVATEGDEDSPHKKGLEMIFHQYQEILKKLGVTEIKAQGQPFDPEKHNAVMHIDDENLGENVVSQVFQAGFLLGDKVIRHAIVQVAN